MTCQNLSDIGNRRSPKSKCCMESPMFTRGLRFCPIESCRWIDSAASAICLYIKIDMRLNFDGTESKSEGVPFVGLNKYFPRTETFFLWVRKTLFIQNAKVISTYYYFFPCSFLKIQVIDNVLWISKYYYIWLYL